MALTLAACLAGMVSAARADQPSLNPHLEPLRPLLGKTWQGTFQATQSGKPVVDVARWEGREDEGVLVIPRAGERLFRVGRPPDPGD